VEEGLRESWQRSRHVEEEESLLSTRAQQ
jgi:hypothetical protein